MGSEQSSYYTRISSSLPPAQDSAGTLRMGTKVCTYPLELWQSHPHIQYQKMERPLWATSRKKIQSPVNQEKQLVSPRPTESESPNSGSHYLWFLTPLIAPSYSRGSDSKHTVLGHGYLNYNYFNNYWWVRKSTTHGRQVLLNKGAPASKMDREGPY